MACAGRKLSQTALAGGLLIREQGLSQKRSARAGAGAGLVGAGEGARAGERARARAQGDARAAGGALRGWGRIREIRWRGRETSLLTYAVDTSLVDASLVDT